MKRAITTGLFVSILIVIVLGAFGFLGTVQWGSGPLPFPEVEIRILCAASESYKTDTGHYPSDSATTDQLNPNTTFDPAAYIASSAFLYRALAGGSKNYLVHSNFPAKMLKTNNAGITYIVDPWGNSIGYSTFKFAHPNSPDGYNTTFDLWSTGGNSTKVDPTHWIRNW